VRSCDHYKEFQGVTTLYLQRIEISNFRAYGDNFSLSLPGPGVTILTGPDGLGKSSFFEAIEWALTGRVPRLEAHSQESLDRGRNNGLLARREEGVPVARYGVSLEFVGGEGASTRIERHAVRDQENHEQFVENSSPAPLDVPVAEARARHAAAHATLVGLQERLRAVLEVDERRRAAELKRATLLQLSAARVTIAQGVPRKTSVAAGIDRHTHELWMVQAGLHKTTKTIQRIKDLDRQIDSLLLKKQEFERPPQARDEEGKEAESLQRIQLEIEAAQAARDQLPDLEYLNEDRASMNATIDRLSSSIKEELEVVAQLEKELLAARTLQQQHPELLAALGTLPSDEAHAIDEAARAVEQLVHEERRLVQSEEPLPSVLLELNEERSRWGQWPAALIDDALQHHALTNAAAFIKVLGELVRDRKYQVILSIRDEELADSLRRELEEAGIECATCRYKGLSPTGVLYSTV
jgi:chromosome segregation ATPase